jgi:hypothetical protein
MQNASSGKVSWTGDRLSYGEISLDMSQVRRMVSLLSYDIRRMLDSLLLFNIATPAISLQNLADSPSSLEAGFSFVRHPRNHDLIKSDSKRWLLDRVIRSEHLQPLWFVDRTKQL